MINYTEKYNSSVYYILAFGCFGIFILQRIEGFSLKIGTAVPVLLIPAVISIACFLREWTGFWFGLFCGIALDTVTNGTSCFNTFLLIIIGFFSGIAFHYIINRNIKSVLIVSALSSIIYFTLKWFFLTVLTNDSSATTILLKYELPSALYTIIFIVPFFFSVKWLTEKNLVQKS